MKTIWTFVAVMRFFVSATLAAIGLGGIFMLGHPIIGLIIALIGLLFAPPLDKHLPK